MLKTLCDMFRKREEEYAHASVVLLDDVQLQALAAAFSLMTPPMVRIMAGTEAHRVLCNAVTVDGLSPEFTFAAVWDRLWQSTVVDWRELAARAGIDTTSQARTLFKRLIAARVVYPDGTISETASDILNARTVREIERMSGRRQRGGGEA